MNVQPNNKMVRVPGLHQADLARIVSIAERVDDATAKIARHEHDGSGVIHDDQHDEDSTTTLPSP